jgi:hypothetical protein
MLHGLRDVRLDQETPIRVLHRSVPHTRVVMG